MQENEIRSDGMIVESNRLHKLDEEKILLKSDYFEEVDCPACAKGDTIFLWEKGGFDFVECSFCGTVFVTPRPTKEMLLDFYTTSLKIKFWSEEVYLKTKEARTLYLVLPRVKKVLDLCDAYKIPMDSIMDVGAGFGTFCDQVAKARRFKKVIAVDPTLKKGMIDNGVVVFSDFIESITERKVDVITSFESIEHMFSPKEFLSSVFRRLNSGGLLYLTTPNIKGFDLNVLKSKSDNVLAPEHLNYFHSKSISLLLEDCGFEVLNIETFGKLDAQLVRKKVYSGALSLDTNPFLQQVLIDDWAIYGESFQKWLAANGLSSNMTVVARKKE